MGLTFVLISLALLLARLVLKYGRACAVHPASWFSVVWFAAFLAYAAMEQVGAVPVVNELVFEQLVEFVTVTSFAFVALTLIPIRKKPNEETRPRDAKLAPQHTGLVLVGFLGALINWLVLSGSFSYDDNLRQQWLESIPPITAATWYLYLFSFPAAICGGWFTAQSVQTNRWVGLRRPAVILPLMAGFFWTLSTGGRQAFGLIIFVFVVGLSLGLQRSANSTTTTWRQSLRFVGVTLVAAMSLSIFVSITGESRAQQQGTEADAFAGIWWAAPVGQFISYTGLAIAAHQSYGEPPRRDLSETGPVSLAGLQEFGLRYLTGWRRPSAEDTNPERALAASGLPLASATRNVFYDLQADFGLNGGLTAAVALAAVAHALFIFRTPFNPRRILRQTPLIMSILFWGYSHQFSLLMFNTFFWLVMAGLVWDLVARVKLGTWRSSL